MPFSSGKALGSSLFQRKLKKVLHAEGITIDWNGAEVEAKVEVIMEEIEKELAEEIKSGAMAMVKDKAYETGSLYNSIRVEKSKYRYGGYLVWAGDDKVDYASYVETGRFFAGKSIDKNPKDYKRVEAVPFLRQPLAKARKKMRRKLIEKFRAYFR